MVLAIWKKIDLNSCSSNFNIDGCYLTVTESFTARLTECWWITETLKATCQIYPKNHGLSSRNRYGCTLSPHKTRDDSTLWRTYLMWHWITDGRLILCFMNKLWFKLRKQKIFPQVLDKKDMLFCWIVSNWNEKHKWVKYYNELKNHIEMYAFGRHFGKAVSDAQYKEILTTCIFYLLRRQTLIMTTWQKSCSIPSHSHWGSMIHIQNFFCQKIHPREGFLQPSEPGWHLHT